MDLIRVGTFEVYPTERTLSAAGKPLELGARAFDLLLVLIEHQGRLVTKATLLERVWPNVFVDENNLPAQIASLRRVLGAGAIRTVPGFGYRLELEVSRPEAAEQRPGAVIASSRPAPAPFPIPSRAWPDRLKPLVGREEDLRDIEHALTQSCLVTVVGIAGVGKTRLAQEILIRETGKPGAAVAWVSLAPLDEVALLPSAIAIALGISLPDGVEGFAALGQALDDVPLLLVLDSAEHLPDIRDPLVALLNQTRALRLLVTSQAPLDVAGETVYRLASLPVPTSDAPPTVAVQYAAVAMFAQRASAADRRFSLSAANVPTIAEICRRLDGIPLALELAAARISALGATTLLERLDDRFRLLKVSSQQRDSRHSALHTAFDWSYGLLTPAEQRVFNRLGAFAGSFSLKAAARCAVDENIDMAEAMDLIGRLVERSLVTVLEVDPPRYTLLETARVYAQDKLAAKGELEAARKQMAFTMLELLDVAYQEYWSLDEVIWLHRYEPDLDNVRAAMEWAAQHDRSLGVALFGSAWPLLVETDLLAEGRARYSEALTLLSDSLPTARVARLWEAIATYDSTRRCDRARYAAELAAKMYGDAKELRAQYYTLVQLAFNWRTDADAARSAFEAARKLEDPAWPARLLTHGALTEGALLMNAGDCEGARAAYQRAMKLALTTSERQALDAAVHIVELDIARGDTSAALQLGRPMMASLLHVGRSETRFELLVMVFSALLLTGELNEARSVGAELYELAVRLDASKLYTVLDAMAFLACLEHRHPAAARIAVCSDISHEAHGQSRRRPAEEKMRSAALQCLGENLGSSWRENVLTSRDPLNEAAACSLALGLST